MMAAPRHRQTGCPRLPMVVVRYAAALFALAIVSTASSIRVQAQDGWAPVVVAVVPPQKPAYAPQTPSPASRPRLPLKTASPSPLSPQPVDLPPLATLAAQTAGTSEQRRTPADPPETDVRLAREYCLSIADAAADARLAWQKQTLADLEQEIAKRVALLEAKTAEYQRWLARRDEFSKKAQENVVTIYARMKPEAAAAQLVAMDEETAAAVLTKLDPRSASAILSEMEATQAARLTATIGGAANVNLPGRPKPPTGDKKS
jgi:flagellar motility protein MotE (MotC chaperone)